MFYYYILKQITVLSHPMVYRAPANLRFGAYDHHGEGTAELDN